jgi:hypothetical protein
LSVEIGRAEAVGAGRLTVEGTMLDGEHHITRIAGPRQQTAGKCLAVALCAEGRLLGFRLVTAQEIRIRTDVAVRRYLAVTSAGEADG